MGTAILPLNWGGNGHIASELEDRGGNGHIASELEDTGGNNCIASELEDTGFPAVLPPN